MIIRLERRDGVNSTEGDGHSNPDKGDCSVGIKRCKGAP